MPPVVPPPVPDCVVVPGEPVLGPDALVLPGVPGSLFDASDVEPDCAHPKRCPGGQPLAGGSNTVAISVMSCVSIGGALATACASCDVVPTPNEAEASPAHAG
ncbi:hypothetical protein [Pararobbsia silviterrae]|uniref:hypothetical protein n=1 Tax=Pararobbsia silviterrae TaxID=1792498 RepID=UPI00140D960E|nr:hypothetical protein [Pararobbsia silviterrae]